MLRSLLYQAVLFLVLGACLHTAAQTGNKADLLPESPQPANDESVPRVPGVNTLLRGFNAGMTFSQAHDSSAGWYNVITPAVSYTISLHYSADASASIYPYRLVQNQNPATLMTERLISNLGDAGDTFVGLHASFNPSTLRNTTSFTFTIPTGDRSNGLGTGRFTFDLSDHIEHSFQRSGVILDLGGGDSSGLFNRLVTKEENSLGALAHFQTGAFVYLSRGIRFQSTAYELLPIGHQTVYTAVSPPGVPSLPAISGNGLSEDNGFTTSLSIPLSDHFTLWGYYNRSLRQHTDTVSTGITYVIRGASIKRELSLIDRALREAEEANK